MDWQALSRRLAMPDSIRKLVPAKAGGVKHAVIDGNSDRFILPPGRYA
jgi:hypothetical protein